MKKIIVFITIATIGFVSCNSGNNNSKTDKADSTGTLPKTVPPAVSSSLNDSGTTKLMAVISNYYGLKNACVATNAANTESSAIVLLSAAKNLQGYLLGKDEAPGPLKPYLDTIILQSKTIAESKDKSCEKQRIAFGVLSSAMYGLIKNANIKNVKIYHEFCPMAFNEKGATWLSDESEIKNPYFGDKMMECGEVTDSIK